MFKHPYFISYPLSCVVYLANLYVIRDLTASGSVDSASQSNVDPYLLSLLPIAPMLRVHTAA